VSKEVDFLDVCNVPCFPSPEKSRGFTGAGNTRVLVSHQASL